MLYHFILLQNRNYEKYKSVYLIEFGGFNSDQGFHNS